VAAQGTYRAVVCSTLGGIDCLQLRQLPRAPLPPNGVRVAIKAAGLNFPDVLMCRGAYQHRPALPFVPGLEAAGIVSELASGTAAAVEVGEPVIVQTRTGGYAEEIVASPEQLRPMPAAFSFAEAATFLVAHLTAYHALKTRAELKGGQTLLVLGAGGGVGLAAVQIGKLLGARVIAAASSASKRDAAQAMGADAVIEAGGEAIAEALKRLTEGAGADVVLDPVGIAQEAALRSLAWGGKLLVVGFAGQTIPAYAANRVLLRGASVLGVRAGESGRRDRSMRRGELAELALLARQGRVRPMLSESFPLQRFAEAMRRIAERQAIGRIALVTEP
jgi:NADPH2:quinone reductase